MVTFPLGKKDSGECECLATPAVQEVTGETHFSPAAPKVLKWDLHDLGREEIVKEADKGLHSC